MNLSLSLGQEVQLEPIYSGIAKGGRGGQTVPTPNLPRSRGPSPPTPHPIKKIVAMLVLSRNIIKVI